AAKTTARVRPCRRKRGKRAQRSPRHLPVPRASRPSGAPDLIRGEARAGIYRRPLLSGGGARCEDCRAHRLLIEPSSRTTRSVDPGSTEQGGSARLWRSARSPPAVDPGSRLRRVRDDGAVWTMRLLHFSLYLTVESVARSPFSRHPGRRAASIRDLPNKEEARVFGAAPARRPR